MSYDSEDDGTEICDGCGQPMIDCECDDLDDDEDDDFYDDLDDEDDDEDDYWED